MPSPTVVLIHGLFITKACWDGWVAHYRSRGLRCIAPAYPERDLPVATLKARHPDPATAKVTLADVLDHLANEIRRLDEPPILMGHSFGGLLTQLLLQRGLGACGVAIDSVPPAGVVSLKWSFVRSVWPSINPLVPKSRPYYMSFPHFRYAFVHTLPPAEQRRVYDSQVVPESRRLASGGLSKLARVDFAKARPPLLMIAGAEDHIIPASLNRRNHARYRSSPSVTDFHEFPGRAHYLLAEPGWEEVADYAIDWALKQTGSRPTAQPDRMATT